MTFAPLKDRYIDPKTDFGFKYLFGTELNKDLLIGFLNALFRGEHVVKNVTYLNSEQLGIDSHARRAIFDVYCEGENGDRFIVEMQNAYQQFFKDRSIYYSTFPIQEASNVGAWDFRLPLVYTVGILNFVFDEDRDSEDYYHHEVKLMDVNRKTVFYEKLTYIYLELPKFRKQEGELETLFDKWMYVLKNLSRLMDRPAALQERVFTRLFDAAEIARFTPEQRRGYDDSLKAFRDMNNIMNSAKKKATEEGWKEGMEKGLKEGLKEGLEKGLEEGRKEGLKEGELQKQLEIARKMQADGLPLATIMKYTGLSAEEIEKTMV